MPIKLDYTVIIKNIFTNQPSRFTIERGTIEQVVYRINLHYGINFISHAVVANIISRPSLTHKKYHHIQILKNTSTGISAHAYHKKNIQEINLKREFNPKCGLIIF